jgi:hypothetical protein
MSTEKMLKKKTSKNTCREKNVEKNISNEKMSKEKMSIVWECRMKITVKYLEGDSESEGEDNRGE